MQGTQDKQTKERVRALDAGLSALHHPETRAALLSLGKPNPSAPDTVGELLFLLEQNLGRAVETLNQDAVSKDVKAVALELRQLFVQVKWTTLRLRFYKYLVEYQGDVPIFDLDSLSEIMGIDKLTAQKVFEHFMKDVTAH